MSSSKPKNKKNKKKTVKPIKINKIGGESKGDKSPKSADDPQLSEEEALQSSPDIFNTKDEGEENEDNLGDNMDYGEKIKEEGDEQKEGDETGAEEPDTDSDTGEIKLEPGARDETGTEEPTGDKDIDDEDCLYKFAPRKTNAEDENEDADDEIEQVFDDDNVIHKDAIVAKEEKSTKPYLTKYERVRILGTRSRQLLSGAKPMLKGVDNLHPKEIARLELEHGVVPFKIERLLPNGKIEIWDIKDLKIVN